MSEPKHHAFLYKRGSVVVYTKPLETHAPNVCADYGSHRCPGSLPCRERAPSQEWGLGRIDNSTAASRITHHLVTFVMCVCSVGAGWMWGDAANHSHCPCRPVLSAAHILHIRRGAQAGTVRRVSLLL